MERTIGQRDLRNLSGEVMRAVEAGATFVVTRNGIPVAELRPLRARRTFVPREDLLRLASAAAHIDAARFRADVDAPLDQSIHRP
jgi:prevent-host-death family protein